MSTAPAAIANSHFMLFAASGPDANQHRPNKVKLPGLGKPDAHRGGAAGDVPGARRAHAGGHPRRAAMLTDD
ncbi:MAG: hypothetical protein WBP81_05005 [Solirubrobacteraceae bacterium]